MLTLQDITYIHPNRDLLFEGLNLSLNNYDKIALIGNNGTGKSTLLKLMALQLHPAKGLVKTSSTPYYVPQVLGALANVTVAEALGVADRISALHEILNGNVSDQNLATLNNDWTVEERCAEALAGWNLDGLSVMQPMGALSGGQKTRVLLAGIILHQPEIVLLDEPSNHLDTAGRALLYDYIRSTNHTLLVVSHDRTLLNLVDTVYELGDNRITVYGGNYEFYTSQKLIENEALERDLKSKEKALRKARDVERESLERQQKLDARGKKKQEKAGQPTIMMNTLRNNAERSTSRMRGIHAEKVGSISQDLTQLRAAVPDIGKMKVDLENSALYKGKPLVTIKDVNFGFSGPSLWTQPLNLQLSSGDRVVLEGSNGSGKTTLVKLILGILAPHTGTITRPGISSIYFDQDYSLINDHLSVYEQAQLFNSGTLQEHEVKIRLNRFLFDQNYWHKLCSVLSGGEKMRLALCSLTISNRSPDLIILDEPTNNLDIQNTDILAAAINDYKGTLIVISHDAHFVGKIGVTRRFSIG